MSPDFWIKNGISYEKTFVSDDEDQYYEDVDSTSLDDDDAQDMVQRRGGLLNTYRRMVLFTSLGMPWLICRM